VGNKIAFLAYQDKSNLFPQVTPQECNKSVQYIDAEGLVAAGALAVFKALAQTPNYGFLVWIYLKIPGFAPLSEWIYRLVANHRWFFSKLTHLFIGSDPSPARFDLSREIFLRSLGSVYFFAFLSLGVQIKGLIGKNGIMPAQEYLDAVANHYGAQGFFLLPSLLWINANDMALVGICIVGSILSLILILGIASGPILSLLWVFYLSLFNGAGIFLGYQWDILLLETGFLAIFFASWRLNLPFGNKSITPLPPAIVLRWLFYWLLFRLMFSSGFVKLASGDDTWRTLNALIFHYESQPIPTKISWYIHQLPSWVQKASVLIMFAVEFGAPLLIMGPRKMRFLGAGLVLGFMVLIILTGNYGIFNLLAIVLCLICFDDKFWLNILPPSIVSLFRSSPSHSPDTKFHARLVVSLGIFIFILSTLQFSRQLGIAKAFSLPLAKAFKWAAPFHFTSTYGLFAVMTTSRQEIVLEGSQDKKDWKSYEFKWKAGDLKRPPPQVAPHMPRLDWQMWFASLGHYRQNRWFMNFIECLLEGKSDVLKLLANNPFPETPPRYIRALLYDYQFSDLEQKKREGVWWKREIKGLYCPVVSLKESP